MEHVTKVVVDLEVLDKRETGGNSAVMGREGLRRLLGHLMNKLPLNELCTDASTTIIKLLRNMKGKLLLALTGKCLESLLLGFLSWNILFYGCGSSTEYKIAGFLLRLRATNLWTL